YLVASAKTTADSFRSKGPFQGLAVAVTIYPLLWLWIFAANASLQHRSVADFHRAASLLPASSAFRHALFLAKLADSFAGFQIGRIAVIRVAILTTDNREHHRRYELTVPYFGQAIEALLQGFSELPEV